MSYVVNAAALARRNANRAVLESNAAAVEAARSMMGWDDDAYRLDAVRSAVEWDRSGRSAALVEAVVWGCDYGALDNRVWNGSCWAAAR